MSTAAPEPANHPSFTLTIDGMTCGHCVQAVTKALSDVPGIAVRSIELGSAQITATDGITVARAVAALDEAGYTVRAGEMPTSSTARVPTGSPCCGGATSHAAQRQNGCCG